MEEIQLYTSDNGFVVTVLVPAFKTPPDAVIWGERIFLRRPDGVYREGFTYYALYTKEELK